jgi:hypothetical protein
LGSARATSAGNPTPNAISLDVEMRDSVENPVAADPYRHLSREALLQAALSTKPRGVTDSMWLQANNEERRLILRGAQSTAEGKPVTPMDSVSSLDLSLNAPASPAK